MAIKVAINEQEEYDNKWGYNSHLVDMFFCGK